MAGLKRQAATKISKASHTRDNTLVNGCILAFLSAFLLVLGIYALVLSPILMYLEMPPLELHRSIAADTHYKYFLFLIVPAGLLFVIANWVGWQYYQNS